MRNVIAALFVLLSVFPCLAGEVRCDSVFASVEAHQTLSSGDHSPFWLAANKQGLSSVDKGFGFVEVGAVKHMDKSSRFSWGAGVDLAVPWKFTSSFVIQQLYAEVKWRSLSLSVGSRNHESMLVDSDLSSGELLFSGNARPVPQVRAGIMEFQPLRFTNNWVGIKGFLAYGKFTDSSWQQHWAAPGSRYSKGAFMSDRAIWLKGGDENRFPLVFNVGLEMATQFEGTIYNCDLYREGKEIVDLKMPGGFSAWFKALVPLPGGSGTIATESTNVEGNTVGTWNFSLEWIPQSDWKIKAYWQHMFEDHSMLWVEYPWKDGLWGVQAWLPRNPVIKSVVAEFLYSKFQSGSVYNDTTPEVPEQVSGVDMYYNHELYPGWMHWGMGIGNPFSISPIYNADHILRFTATRNISWHLGITGSPSRYVDWKVLLSNTRSWGDYWYPFPEVRKMWNFLAGAKWRPSKVKGLECNLEVAFDRGDLVGNNFGVLLGVRYEMPVFSFKK